MNKKEIAELRRSFRPDKSNITSIRGCYVNENKEVLSDFSQSLPLLEEGESENFLDIFKRTLSGTLERNLMNIEFSTQQVAQGEEHQLLCRLRDSKLQDDEAVRSFFETVIPTVSLKENYVILLGYGIHDVPYRSKDNQPLEDASSDVFSYVLCSICPVKPTKPALSYHVPDNEFRSRKRDWIVSAPELGFLFPAFDDGGTNLYGALYYTRNTKLSYHEFVDAVFVSEIPVPAATQKEIFQEMLSATLAEESSLNTVQAVHGQLQQMIELHKESGEPEPLALTKDTVKRVFESGGVSEEGLEVFEQEFDKQFGAQAALRPANVVDAKRTELIMPEVTIRVNAGGDDLLETRVIDGKKYVMIRVEEGVEINGVPIQVF